MRNMGLWTPTPTSPRFSSFCLIFCYRYTSQQLKYFPINKAVYDSPRKLDSVYADPNVMASDDGESVEESSVCYNKVILDKAMR